MDAVSSPSLMTLNEADVKNLYPQLFAELAAFESLSDQEFALRFASFITELERDFRVEEQWLQKLETSLQQTHRAEHAELLRLLHHAQARVLAGDCQLARKIVPLLTHWFADHVSTMDTAWANLVVQEQPPLIPAMLDAA